MPCRKPTTATTTTPATDPTAPPHAPQMDAYQSNSIWRRITLNNFRPLTAARQYASISFTAEGDIDENGDFGDIPDVEENKSREDGYYSDLPDLQTESTSDDESFSDDDRMIGHTDGDVDAAHQRPPPLRRDIEENSNLSGEDDFGDVPDLEPIPDYVFQYFPTRDQQL
jgi:hypothetical protein